MVSKATLSLVRRTRRLGSWPVQRAKPTLRACGVCLCCPPPEAGCPLGVTRAWHQQAHSYQSGICSQDTRTHSHSTTVALAICPTAGSHFQFSCSVLDSFLKPVGQPLFGIPDLPRLCRPGSHPARVPWPLMPRRALLTSPRKACFFPALFARLARSSAHSQSLL